MIIACDTSPYELGAVLSHIMPDESERPCLLQELSQMQREITPKLKRRR